jgi:CcmD family protein
MFRKILFTILLFINTIYIFAQTAANEVEMADVMRSNGKIYVVVAVIAIIFAGIVVYLVNLDRKISKIEKRLNK